jgi:hypothetical protein
MTTNTIKTTTREIQSVRQFRRLEMGEIVLATDEIYDDHKREWVEPEWSVGKPAPDPAYTSHRQFRREINSLPGQ